MFQQAKRFMDENTFSADSYDEFKSNLNNGGFVRCGWDGNAISEAAIKSETKATIRCIPLDPDPVPGKCMVTGEPSEREVVFAVAY